MAIRTGKAAKGRAQSEDKVPRRDAREGDDGGDTVHAAHEHLHTSEDGYIEACVEALRQAGARVTQPRLAVLGALAASRRPLTPRQLLELLRAERRAPDIDQVTVYRILEAFVGLGLVHQIGPSGEFVACSHLSCSSPLHIFARCIECGRFDELDVPAEIMAPIQQYLKHKIAFEPREHLLSVSGACEECRSKSSRRTGHST